MKNLPTKFINLYSNHALVTVDYFKAGDYFWTLI